MGGGMRGNRLFLRAVQIRAARIAASASAARGQGAGTVAAARAFLTELDLRRFGVIGARAFRSRLDSATHDLQCALPKRARSWGLARKLLNIFLRDCLYSTHLSQEYGLESTEAFFEVPLDSITAKRLRQLAGRASLPPWLGVKHLLPEVSKRYQQFAEEVGQIRGIAQVHLDTYWWGARAA